MASVFAYIFYFIVASISPLQRRHLAKHKITSENSQIQFAFYVTLIIFILSPALILIEPFRLSGNIYKILLLAIPSGIACAFVYILQYKAQQHIEAGVTTLVMNIYTPVTIVLSSIFIHEALNGRQVVGTILLLLAMFIVSKKHHLGRLRFEKYFVMMLVSGISLGFVLVLERALQNTAGWTAGTIISWGAQCFFLGIAALITKSKSEYSLKDTAITGILKFLQNLSWVLLLLFVGNLSVVSSVTTFKVVIMFILGAIFLHEKEDISRKIIGSLIAVAGLLLMR